MSVFQKTVRRVAGLGVPGEILMHGPKRAGAYVLNSDNASAAQLMERNVIGHAFTFRSDADGQVQAGNGGDASATFAGLLSNPKVYAYRGSLINPDNDQLLFVPNGVVGEFVTMGIILGLVDKPAKVGDYIAFDNITGALTVVAKTADGSVPAAPSGKTLVPNANVDRYPQTNASGGLVVIRLTN